MKRLKKCLFKKNKYHDNKLKYYGIEIIKYLFEDDNEDYNLYKRNQQYQSFSSKALLPPNEYLGGRID